MAPGIPRMTTFIVENMVAGEHHHFFAGVKGQSTHMTLMILMQVVLENDTSKTLKGGQGRGNLGGKTGDAGGQVSILPWAASSNLEISDEIFI